MAWYDFALNPLAVSNLYSDVPSLTKVQIQNIVYSSDSLSLKIVISLPYPDRVPKRWQYQGYNAVHVVLGVSRLLDFQMVDSNLYDEVSVELTELAKASLLLEMYYQSMLIMRVHAEYLYLTVNRIKN